MLYVDLMSPELQMQVLQEALERLEVSVREEAPPGEGNGGFCVLRGVPTVFLRPGLRPVERVAIMIDALQRLPTDSIWLPPRLRRRLDSNSLSLSTGE